MVQSVSAVSTAGKVSRDQDRGSNSSDRDQQTGTHTFSKILEKEVEERRNDSIHCKSVIYGKESRRHPFEDRVREYN